jgi:RimJ/RimL family protein N-acetyltransferase
VAGAAESEARHAVVRPMELAEVDVRTGYFHRSSDQHLGLLGVDRDALPSPQEWRRSYEEDHARPLTERRNYSLVWELDGRIVGFSSTDQIEYGEKAFMHLHVINGADRNAGLGTEFVRLSAAEFFRVLELKRLFCQPNAFNVAPNRVLQRVGFRYLFTKEMKPGPINTLQPVTRWVLERPS